MNPWRGTELLQQPGWEWALEDEAQLAGCVGRIRDELENGCAALRIRGLRLAGQSEAEVADLFSRICSSLGTPLSQTAEGATLLHVRDQGYAPDDPRVRGPHTNRALRFHSDRCDVIAFLCVHPAAEGGENDLIHGEVLHDAIAERDPSLLEELFRPFPYLRHSVDPGNPRRFTTMPVFSRCAGRLSVSLLRELIDRADRSPDAPDLRAQQRDALDLLEEVAEDAELYARFRQERGDLLLINNWSVLHRRQAFGDAEGAPNRHLMRIWLAMPNSRELAPEYAEHFGATGAGELRGGIWPPGVRPGS